MATFEKEGHLAPRCIRCSLMELILGQTLQSWARYVTQCRVRLKCVGTRAETRFRLSAKRTSPFKSTGASVQATTGSRGVRISGSNT